MALDRFKTHKSDSDPNCPVCSSLNGIIKHIEAHAAQNEKDGRAGAGWSKPLDSEARAVAAEQRRIVRLLKDLLQREVSA
jgi:hypothetical protein